MSGGGEGGGEAGDMTLEQFVGSDCSGNSGETARVLTTSAISSANGEIIVIVDKAHMRKTDDYTTSGEAITFLVKIFDAHEIDVLYSA